MSASTTDEMENVDRLFREMNILCHDEPAADVIYALAMMFAKSIKEQPGLELRDAAKAFGSAVSLELKHPRSLVHTVSHTSCKEKV